MIFLGTRMCGRVDDVPGLFHVETKFLHFQFLPLLPLGSYLVFVDDENKGSMAHIRIRLKSILAAWFRTVLVVVGGITGIVAFFGSFDANNPKPPNELIGAGIVSALCFFCYWLSRRFLRASRAKALTLAREIGLPDARVLACFPSDSAWTSSSPKPLEATAAAPPQSRDEVFRIEDFA